jgi:hypothetical protein
MLTRSQALDIPREQVVTALMQLRQDWQVSAGRKSLTKIKGNVGLILSDVTTLLGLDTIERNRILGDELTRDVEDILKTTYSMR